MKKLTRILAALAAMTTLTVSTVPVYAYTEAENALFSPNEVQALLEERANIAPEIKKTAEEINGFIKKNRLYANAYTYGYRSGKVSVEVFDGREENEVISAVETFMKENGIDEETVEFIVCHNNDHTTPGVRKAEYYLNNYVLENHIDADISYGSPVNRSEELWSVDENGAPVFTMPDPNDERYIDHADYIFADYLTEKAKQEVESYLKDWDIPSGHLMIREMKQDEKLDFLIHTSLNGFADDNGLTLRIAYKKFDDGTWGVGIKYFLGHEADKDMIEKRIAENGYDKLARISYDLVGDPDADPSEVISDPYEIAELIEGSIAEKGICGSVCVEKSREGKALGVVITLNEYSDNDSYAADIADLMTEKRIDQSIVAIHGLEKDVVESLKGEVMSCDVNSDNKTNIRDCAVIARKIAAGKAGELPDEADYNKDGKKNVRDAAALAKDLANAYNYGIAEE